MHRLPVQAFLSLLRNFYLLSRGNDSNFTKITHFFSCVSPQIAVNWGKNGKKDKLIFKKHVLVTLSAVCLFSICAGDLHSEINTKYKVSIFHVCFRRVTGGELFEDIVAREYYSEADARYTKLAQN